MLVFGTGIVQVFRGDNEGSEEDSVSGAWHAFCDLGETVSESLEVNECSEEGRDLNVGLFANYGDERFK